MIEIPCYLKKPAFALGIVVYGPGKQLLDRLQTAHRCGLDLYIYDNSPDNDLVRNYCRETTRCHYLTAGKNVGLGIGIASISALAYYDKHDALLFFDQDTVFGAETLAFIAEFFVQQRALCVGYSAIVFNAKQLADSLGERFAVRDVLLAISSGSLFFLENLKRLKWHNTSYFVDCVDYEFCLNSANNQLRIGECQHLPGFDHQAEQDDISYSIFGQKRSLRAYKLRRIVDTTTASIRLLIAATASGNTRYFVAILRSYLLYILWQIVARLVKFLKIPEWKQS